MPLKSGESAEGVDMLHSWVNCYSDLYRSTALCENRNTTYVHKIGYF